MSVNQSTTNGSVSIGSGTIGFGISYAITSVFSALLVVLKESSETVYNLLAAMTGHHWVTHGVLDIVVFLVLGFVFSRIYCCSRMTMKALIMLIIGSSVISGLIITWFFI